VAVKVGEEAAAGEDEEAAQWDRALDRALDGFIQCMVKRTAPKVSSSRRLVAKLHSESMGDTIAEERGLLQVEQERLRELHTGIWDGRLEVLRKVALVKAEQQIMSDARDAAGRTSSSSRHAT
jgi:hypothetical protein